MEEPTQPLPSLDIVLNETKVALDRQFEQISSLDVKLGVLLGVSGVILAAILGFLLKDNTDLVTKVLVLCTVALVLISLVLASWGYRIRKYKGPPNPIALREFYLVEEQERTKLAVVDYLCSVYDWNQKRITSKVRYTHFSFVSVFLGAVIIGVTIIYNLL